MDMRSAELTKYAANAMLATRISFMNELAHLADELGADIEKVRQGIGSDPRIGYHFLYPGVGYGGTCFPEGREGAAAHRGASTGIHFALLARGRGGQRARRSACWSTRSSRASGDDLAGRTIALWGLAFKPNTDDMREAPSRVIIDALAGARRAHRRLRSGRDARGAAHLRRSAPDLRFADVAAGSLRRRRRAGDRHRVEGVPQPRLRRAARRACAQPLIFDGRNLYDRRPSCARAGLEYFAIGRRP